MPSLWDRLKERKMVQWTLAYLAGAYGLVQVVDVLADPFGISASAQRAVIVFLGFGFFAALVVAWNHAEKGRQKVTASELAILAMLAVGGVSASVVSYRNGDSAFESASDLRLESVVEGPVVAVLPFENVSAGSEGAASIVRGIHRDILTNLAEVSGINTISRTSVATYERAGRTVRQIAEDLPPTSVILDGTIERIGGTIRIDVWLVDALSDVELWTDVFEDVFDPERLTSIRGEIAGRIADALGVTLAPAEQSRLTHVATRDQEAFELFLLGRDAEDRGDRGERQYYQTALDYYEQALERDSLYADAHAARGMMIHTVYLRVGGTPRTPEIVESIREAAQRAVELDPDLPAAHRLFGEYYRWHAQDGSRARASFQRARDLDPDNVQALRGLAAMDMYAGDFDAARLNLYRAAELDPLDGEGQRMAAVVAIYTRRFDEAEVHVRRAATRYAPDFGSAEPDPASFLRIRTVYNVLMGIYIAADGDTERAYDALVEVMEQTSMTPPSLALHLRDLQPLPFKLGPTLLGIEEVRQFLLDDQDFIESDLRADYANAWMLRQSGEDPERERLLWSRLGDRYTDEQYGGRGSDLRARVFAEVGSEMEMRSTLR